MNQIYARLLAVLLLVFSCSTLSQAQELEITGKVIAAEDGSGLPGVVVVNVSKKTGGSTDIEGMYKVKASVGDVLEYRFLGYTTQSRTVGTLVTIDITLREETKELKEAVVIGYGSLSKKDLTGSIAQVNSKDFQTGTIASPEQLIQGKAAGVQITSNGGAPGGGSVIRIRGGASLNANNDPLYVIDGVPIDGGGIAGSANPLSLINPNDIESFSILKDASATAIYGSRASNGVIIITTKKGVRGQKPTINFTTQNSLAVIARQVEVLSSDQVRTLINSEGSAAQRKMLGNYNNEWQKVIFQQARTTDNNLNYTGGTDKLAYRISAGWFNQEGILKTDKLQRQSMSINLSPNLLDNNLKLNLSLKTSRSASHFADQGAIGAAVTFDPTQPIYSSTRREISPRFGGYYEWMTGKLPNVNATRNPLGLLTQQENISEVYRSIGNMNAEYTMPFFPDLRANLSLGYDVANGQGTNRLTDSAAANYIDKGNRNKYKQEKTNKVVEFQLNYGKTIHDIYSRFELMLGTSYQDFLSTNFNYRNLTYRGDTLAKNPAPKFLFDKPQNRLSSFYGRFQYAYKDGKVRVTATLRRDGSSRFSADNRWGLFPSAGISYNLGDENFIKSGNLISTLKFRAGWGVTGQQDIGGNYSYQSYFGISNNSATYQFGDQYVNLARPSAYDPNIKWEQTTTYNGAMDFGIYKDRITGSLDVYLKETKDLLNTVPTPAGANFSDQITTNVGSMENKGVEFAINTIPVQQEEGFEWSLGFNVTLNQNKITKLNTFSDSTYAGAPTGGIAGGGLNNNIQIQSVGFAANSFYVYKQVYENGKPVEGVYQDLNGDGRVNEKDLYRYKQSAPKIFYGISSQVSFKGFFLGFVIRGSKGNYVYNNVQSSIGISNTVLGQNGFIGNGSPNMFESGFTGLAGDPSKRFFSDYYVKDASFIRMDNLSFGYDFGSIYNDRLLLRLNGNVQNVFVITKYKGIDPEIFNGIDNNFYPRPRVYTVGLSLTY